MTRTKLALIQHGNNSLIHFYSTLRRVLPYCIDKLLMSRVFQTFEFRLCE